MTLKAMKKLILAFLLLGACRGEPATDEHCAAILDRVVELELGEQGYRDPVLTLRSQQELRVTLSREVARCKGLRLPKGAMDCIRRATSSEEISHRCLR